MQSFDINLISLCLHQCCTIHSQTSYCIYETLGQVQARPPHSIKSLQPSSPCVIMTQQIKIIHPFAPGTFGRFEAIFDVCKLQPK